MSGVAVGTAALIIVLSVFNGFEKLVISLMDAVSPDLLITPAEGKVFNSDSLNRIAIEDLQGVATYTEFIEDNALLRYKEEQVIATVRGVSEQYLIRNPLDTMIINGEFALSRNGNDFAMLGYLLAYRLGINLNDVISTLQIYAPRRTARSFSGLNPENAFNRLSIMPGGVFSVQQEFDSRYVIVPIDFTRKLYDYTNQISGVEIRLQNGNDADVVAKEVRKITGPGFDIKNRYQQEELIYKIMKSEKWAIFFILTFILIIATFNIIGSIFILILDKRRDISILFSMGAGDKTIRRIFLRQGMLITLAGIAFGMFIGILLTLLQQEFGLIRLSQNEAAFVVPYYPVLLKIKDILLVILTVFVIGYLASLIPVRTINYKFLREKVHQYTKIQ